MRITALFAHRHRFEAIAVQHKKPPAMFAPVNVTLVLFRCRCASAGHVRTIELAGNWTLAQVRGHRALDSIERIETDLAVDAAHPAVTG